MVKELHRGPQDCSLPGSAAVTAGSPENGLGPAMERGVISLGDGGSIVLGFPAGLADGPGIDFAVFENGFSDGFLELAMVEVSSNGHDFVAFPCFSETSVDRQKGPFDTLDARCIFNLAGKYRAGFGTGFDLAGLPVSAGVDPNALQFVRIRDVVGSVNPAFGSRDSEGRLINDPWPTPFESGGFDLDAVGLIHLKEDQLPMVWPAILRAGAEFHFLLPAGETTACLFDVQGRFLSSFPAGAGPARLPAGLAPGIYFVGGSNRKRTRKIILL